MLYEESMIDGALHWRGARTGKWEPCRPARLNALIAELRDDAAEREAELRRSIARNDALVLAIANAPIASVEECAGHVIVGNDWADDYPEQVALLLNKRVRLLVEEGGDA